MSAANMSPREKEAEDLIRWATARAGVIVIAPVVGSVALMANEIYLVVRLGKLHGYEVSATAAKSFMFGLGGALVGQSLATLIPFPPLQVAIGVSVTYALGQAANAWFKAGMPSDIKQFRTIFKKAKSGAKGKVGDLKVHPKMKTALGDESRDPSSTRS